jgi:site-specific DNA recombinase
MTPDGHPMVAVHTKRGIKRYRYYLSRASLTDSGEAGSLHRISAGVLEQFLAERLVPKIAPSWRPDEEAEDRLFCAITSVRLSDDYIAVRLEDQAFPPEAFKGAMRDDDGLEVRLTFHMRRRQGAMILEGSGGHDPAPKVGSSSGPGNRPGEGLGQTDRIRPGPVGDRISAARRPL